MHMPIYTQVSLTRFNEECKLCKNLDEIRCYTTTEAGLKKVEFKPNSHLKCKKCILGDKEEENITYSWLWRLIKDEWNKQN